MKGTPKFCCIFFALRMKSQSLKVSNLQLISLKLAHKSKLKNTFVSNLGKQKSWMEMGSRKGLPLLFPPICWYIKNNLVHICFNHQRRDLKIQSFQGSGQ